MKLCVNPACSSHCEVIHDELWGWRFASGFGMSLDKNQLAHFDPEDEYNLCPRCEGMIDLLIKLKLLPKHD